MNQALLIYTHQLTPRVRYVFKHIFTRILGLSIEFTTEINEFIAHIGPKLSYTQMQLGNELHFKRVGLLFEQGVSDASIQVSDWEGVPCFFPVKDEKAAIPYDIFAATFYLLSRYEEYLPHVKDALGRFPATESLAAANDFLQLPVIDLWVAKVKVVFSSYYPEIVMPTLASTTNLVVTVPQAFAYRKVGFIRTIGGFAQDTVKLRLRSVFNRLRVILGLRKDPYDVFTWLVNVQKQITYPFTVLFELGDQTGDTTNIKYDKSTFRSLIKMVGDYCNVGLLSSVTAANSPITLKKEKGRLESIVNRPLRISQFSNHQFTIPKSYRSLLEEEVVEDCSMGYPDRIGFRAGTCIPFLFYDLDYEMQTPLLLLPAALPLECVINKKTKTVDSVQINKLKSSIENVGGMMVISCSNKTLSKSYWRNLLKKLILIT